jgi:hypothetical protein
MEDAPMQDSKKQKIEPVVYDINIKMKLCCFGCFNNPTIHVAVIIGYKES